MKKKDVGFLVLVLFVFTEKFNSGEYAWLVTRMCFPFFYHHKTIVYTFYDISMWVVVMLEGFTAALCIILQSENCNGNTGGNSLIQKM